MNIKESVEDRLKELEKQVLMLSVAMGLVMKIMRDKGMVDLDQLAKDAAEDILKKEDNSDKEAEYKDMLKKFEVKKENLN